ncbi:MAG: serine/threonine-protein kinase, partial [Myxococcota bacterium]
DNIMLLATETGQTDVKILDFGIAKLGDVEIGSRPLTEAGMVFGTPRYMSPEQAAGEPVDHRSDLFAVGIILYQLLSGQLPFDGETTVQILRRVLTQVVPRLQVNGLPSATSEGLADVVSRALAKNPSDRYPSARIMREALQGCFPL